MCMQTDGLLTFLLLVYKFKEVNTSTTSVIFCTSVTATTGKANIGFADNARCSDRSEKLRLKI